MKLLIPTATGIEAVVERQLYMLGYRNAKAHFGRVAVEDCDWTDVARLNMFLRSGERVLVCLATFRAENFDELFDGVRNIAWQDYLTPDSRVTVITKTVNSKLFAHNAIQSIGKKAIVAAVTPHFGGLTEGGEEYVVELALRDDIVSVNLDTSGMGLHKRGYRPLTYTAPLKETTAAALIDLSVWNPDKMFTDLFCGSGTLCIEAALKALKIAPGLNRTFAYRNWACVPQTAYERALEEAHDMRVDRQVNIVGGDINPKAIELAQKCASGAGVADYVKFNLRNATDFVTRSSYGVNISNPPYGERLGDLKEVAETTKAMGKLYKTLDNWNFYFLSPYDNFERDFGRRADKKRYIFNAGIKCSYYAFNGLPPKQNKPNKPKK